MTPTVHPHLHALCLDILHDKIGSDHFTVLLLETKVRLETIEWDIANRMIEKGDEITHAAGPSRFTLQ